MKKQFEVSIPKPCHEDWLQMSPNQKGRFCKSCSKSVIDFTTKTNEEIQHYFKENSGNEVCGRFHRDQLDPVIVEIPISVFQRNISFRNLFLLTLLIVMGTTLFSCQKSHGEKQRIQEIILIDSLINIDLNRYMNEFLQHTDLKTKEDLEKEKNDNLNYYYFGGTYFKNTEKNSRETFTNRDINFTYDVHIDSIVEFEEPEEIIEDVPQIPTASSLSKKD